MQGLWATMRHGITRQKKHIKVKEYRKSLQKEPAFKRCLLILDLKRLRSWVKGNHSID